MDSSSRRPRAGAGPERLRGLGLYAVPAGHRPHRPRRRLRVAAPAGLPAAAATSIMLALFGVAGLVAAWRDSAAPYLDWLPVLAGLGLLWTFVQNLTRGIGASYAVANVSAQVSGLVIVLSASTWVAAITIPGDKEAIVIGLAALIV